YGVLAVIFDRLRETPMQVPFPEWQRMTILVVAGLIVALSFFSLWSAAAQWTDLPSNPIVLLYFFVMLVVVPVLAASAFALAWQGRNAAVATVLTAIPAVILLLRAYFIGGI